MVFSALETTRTQAGSIANQWKIDHELNVDLAIAAKAAGVKAFVFVSSTGTRGGLGGMVPYSKMKVGVEDAIKDLNFEQAIILRPGIILGKREVSQSGRALMKGFVKGVGIFSNVLQEKLGQDSLVIARAAARAAILADTGKAREKYWILEADEIVRLGRSD